MLRTCLYTKNLTTDKQLHITYFFLTTSDGACQTPSDLRSALLATPSQGSCLHEQGEKKKSLDLCSLLMHCQCMACGVSSIRTYLRVGCLSMNGRNRTARFGILT